MLIAGLQKLTLLDYPGKIAAIIFTQGCNFACGYCHNPEMIPLLRVLPDDPQFEPRNVLRFLSRRKNLLDGVVITGGEATLQPDLMTFMREIKGMGFLIKLDTNGSNPDVLEKIFERDLVDYVAMDIKHTSEKYRELVKNDCEKTVGKSIALIMRSGVDYEFRSTILPACHSKHDLEEMGKMIRGAKRWYLQNFRPLRTLHKKFATALPFSPEELHTLEAVAKKYAEEVGVRN